MKYCDNNDDNDGNIDNSNDNDYSNDENNNNKFIMMRIMINGLLNKTCNERLKMYRDIGAITRGEGIK